MTRYFLTAAAVLALALPGVASAHSKLVSSTPAANATVPRALPAGSYDLKWHIVGADQHKMEGGYSFKVK